jgi:hypothetical protein
MKKIKTREYREKKERRNKTIIGVILAGLMLLSTAGYAFYNREGGEKIRYNNVVFERGEDGLWHFFIDKEYSTIYNPKELENISVNTELNLNDYKNKPLYFSYDSKVKSINEILRNLGRFISRTQKVCTEECSENLPVKNCSEERIIIIRDGGENVITKEENCVYLISNQGESLKVADKFIFRLLKI